MPNNPGPGPSPSEEVLYDLWDKITDIAERRGERTATAVATAALYAVRTEIEKGTASMTKTPVPGDVLAKLLALRRAYVNKPHALALFDGILGLFGLDVAKLASGVDLAKAAQQLDPAKAIGQLQSARDACELAGDMDGASMLTQAIALIWQASSATTPPAQKLAKGRKSAPTAMEQARRDHLHRLANTAANAADRRQYQQQYDDLVKGQ